MRALLRDGSFAGEIEIDSLERYHLITDRDGVRHEYRHRPELSTPELAIYDYAGALTDDDADLAVPPDMG